MSCKECSQSVMPVAAIKKGASILFVWLDRRKAVSSHIVIYQSQFLARLPTQLLLSLTNDVE